MARRKRTVLAQVMCRYPDECSSWTSLTTNALAVTMLTNRVAALTKDGATASIYVPDLDQRFTPEEYVALPWIAEAIASGDAA